MINGGRYNNGFITESLARLGPPWRIPWAGKGVRVGDLCTRMAGSRHRPLRKVHVHWANVPSNVRETFLEIIPPSNSHIEIYNCAKLYVIKKKKKKIARKYRNWIKSWKFCSTLLNFISFSFCAAGYNFERGEIQFAFRYGRRYSEREYWNRWFPSHEFLKLVPISNYLSTNS